ncbi:MAG TPA: 3-oxoacyl-[acyl-carrier-protein] reductase [Methylomirabilota bacterium]|nr:3-oxoacyl-[acyl-carrier-protein] reductase [Methylomirabilota bacterium]
MSLSGQIALVTGGSRGIGSAVALALGDLGAHVVINYHANQGAAERTLKELIDKGGRGEIAQFDVANETQIEGAIKKIVDVHEKIDILVNNAGVTSDSLLIRMKAEDWELVVGTNLKGTVLCTKAVSRCMIRQRYGRIINLSSVVGQVGNAGQSLYAATKAGVLGFTKAVAREVASRGITVNAVAPGFIETEMTARLSEKLREEFLHSIPLGRFGTCEEVAQVVAFLAGPAAGYITGQVVSINGGLYM